MCDIERYSDTKVLIQGAISVGTYCQAASWLSGRGIQTVRGPFDRILSSLSMVISVLEDNFIDFLDCNQHEGKNSQSNHCTYRSEVSKFHQSKSICIFRHHDITNLETYLKFHQCVHRFRMYLHSHTHKRLFLCMIKNKYTQISEDYRKDISTLASLLKKKTMGLYELLVVYNLVSPNVARASCIMERDTRLRTTLLTFTTGSTTNGTRWLRDEDNAYFTYCMDQIFRFSRATNIGLGIYSSPNLKVDEKICQISKGTAVAGLTIDTDLDKQPSKEWKVTTEDGVYVGQIYSTRCFASDCKERSFFSAPYCYIHLQSERNLAIAPSRIMDLAGKCLPMLGLFAMIPFYVHDYCRPRPFVFKDGDIIGEYVSEVLTENGTVYGGAYARYGVVSKDKLIFNRRDKNSSYRRKILDPYRRGSYELESHQADLDAALVRPAVAFMNTSASMDDGVVNVVITDPIHPRGFPLMVAVATIYHGEELLCDYPIDGNVKVHTSRCSTDGTGVVLRETIFSYVRSGNSLGDIR